MKFLPKLALILTTAASCAAGAATLTPQADQERRDRNNEEALAAYRASPESHGAYDDNSVTGKAKHASKTVSAEASKATKPVRDFTHRQLDKSRAFEARQNAKYGMTATPNKNGETLK
jgi:hypothetical protein